MLLWFSDRLGGDKPDAPLKSDLRRSQNKMHSILIRVSCNLHAALFYVYRLISASFIVFYLDIALTWISSTFMAAKVLSACTQQSMDVLETMRRLGCPIYISELLL